MIIKRETTPQQRAGIPLIASYISKLSLQDEAGGGGNLRSQLNDIIKSNHPTASGEKKVLLPR